MYTAYILEEKVREATTGEGRREKVSGTKKIGNIKERQKLTAILIQKNQKEEKKKSRWRN